MNSTNLLLPRAVLAALWLCLSLATGFAADVRVGLVSYWPLDVDNGGTTPDYGPLGNPMTVFNGSTIVAGQYTNAFSFNGTSQYLGITHTTDNSTTGLPIYTSPNGYTICFWVKGPAVGSGNLNGRYVFTQGNSTAANPLVLFQTRNAGTGGQLDVFIRNDGGGNRLNHVLSQQVVFDNTWHHVAWTDYRGAGRLYVDGNPDASFLTNYPWAETGVTLNTTAIGALIRSAVSGYATNTTLDEVTLWQRVLSAAEINQVRTNGLSIPAVPEIVQQPAGSTNHLGDLVTFSVSAVGFPAPTYQWRKDDVELPGKTSTTLKLTDLTASGSNVFSVVIANANGTVTSSYAPLVVVADGPADPSVGLVSYWPMDVVHYLPGSTNTPDLYYSHTDLMLSNLDQSFLVTGQVSNALRFNVTGSSQYAKRVGGSPIYNATNYTIAFWVNGYAGQQNKQLFAEGGNNDFFLLGTENSAPYGGLLNVKMSLGMSDRKSTRTVFDNTWHHVVWVDENGKGKLYVDGVLDETDFSYSRSNLVLSTTAVGALFRAAAANFFTGDVDDIAMWNRRLSFTEIQEIRTKGVPAPSIVAPLLTQQPVGSTNHLGDRLTLSITATGTDPSYQWRKDGVALSGQTDTSLALLFTSAATNDFTVVVTNIAGALTSSPAHVVVLPDAPVDVRAGLFYYWPLDTVSDGPPVTTPDLYSADPFVLTNMDSGALTPGRFGNALLFDGVQRYGQRSGGYPIYLTTNYTVSFWVNGSPGQFNTQVFAEGGTGGNFFLLGTENSTPAGGLLNVKISPGMSDRKSTRTVFDNTWHHVVWVDENGQGKLYIDGTLDETDFAYTRAASMALQTTAIGALVRSAPGNYFGGYIDDVAIWNRRLSWTEIGQLESTGIPAALAPLPPAIFSQPADKTNDVWATDLVTFSVLASGTGPLAYQWLKDGVALSPALNATATNGTLTFSSVQTTDAGSYAVIITNTVGAVTSSVAQLTVIPYTPITNGEAVKLDFGKTGSLALQPGFTEMNLALSGTNFDGVKVTLSPIGSVSLAERNRLEGGALVVDNPPGLTQSLLYNDFIYANSGTDGRGLQIRLERLAHNTPFGVTIWSYDPQSVGARSSDWTETGSGSSVSITNGYTFDGNVPPTHDYDDTLGALLTSSATGVLQIEARRNGGATSQPGVFINAIRLVANPVIRITSAQVAGGNLRLTLEAQYPGQTGHVEQTSDVTGGSWSPATPVAAEVHGPLTIVDFPLGTGPVFYRVVSP